MSTDLLQHLRNIVERRGFAAALDAIGPIASGSGATQHLEIEWQAGDAATEETVEMTVAGEALATPFHREGRACR